MVLDKTLVSINNSYVLLLICSVWMWSRILAFTMNVVIEFTKNYNFQFVVIWSTVHWKVTTIRTYISDIINEYLVKSSLKKKKNNNFRDFEFYQR